ncbi:hypothetical protein Tco_1526929 [Tanacetum coccineum]
MAHLVTSITLNNARFCVMQSAFLTQGTVSNIPIVFSWSDSIRPEGFLSSILLWLVIIVAVVGVGVTVVVVVEKAVTFPSILRDNPSMKNFIIFSESGTVVRHKVANSWNLLTRKIRRICVSALTKRPWRKHDQYAAWQVTVTGSRLLPVAGPLFMQFLSAFLTQGMVSSISIIFSCGGSISPEGFLSSVLLWLVIIVAVVSVGVTVVVVIIVVVVVVVESSFAVKLSFVIT